MNKITTGIDWLRRQPLSTRLIFSGAFASISVFAWFMGQIWPWGIIMAILPLVLGKRSSVDEEFFREAKETGETPAAMFRIDVKEAELAQLLERLSSATTSGFGTDQVKMAFDGGRALNPAEERRFQYVVVVAGRPTSLQLTVRRKSAEDFELAVLGDAALVAQVRP